MRKIKFRGKSLTGEWFYGYLQEFQEHSAKRLCICVASVKTWKDALLYEVKPETVGQFTGLYDKNGTEIYEGDIYRYKEPDSINEVSYCIGGGFAGFDLSPTYHDENRLLDVEILGNIHDNANLLYSD